MLMWCPPTPPRLENDVYVDQSMCFLYDSAVMTESQLPPVYIKKERKRPRDSNTAGGIPKKKSRIVEEVQSQQHSTLTHRPPRSLFDRPTATLLKLRRDKSMMRHPGMSGTLMKFGMGGSGVQKTPQPDTGHPEQPEWLIHEDWSLLQAVQTLLQLPLNLAVVSPAHIPNWELVSDIVSTTSRIFRSPKQCRLRYENVIIPREEGKLLYEANPRKQQKKPPKAPYKTKSNKPMRTGQLYTQDSGSSVTTLHAFRFDCIKNVASKRAPTLRPTLVNPTMKNPKHTAVISESGIQYDSPLNPEEVAKIRQDRIRNEKNKAAAEQQQRVSQGSARSISASSNVLQHATAIISPATKSALQATGVSIARTLPGSIVVNTPGSFTAINKRLATSNATVAGITHVTQASGLSAQSRKISVQDVHQLHRTNPGLMQRVQGAGVTGAQRTITVQQPVALSQQGKSLATTAQLTQAQLNILKQQRAVGTTLVAQRATVSGASQLLPGQVQQTVVSGVPTLVKTVSSGTGVAGTIPVSAAVNINVSLAQQKNISGAAQGATVGKTLTATPQQFRQIQLLSTTKARALSHQKLGLTQAGKPHGASVQIVQQKIGQQKYGVQQIQQLFKQQQAHAQIITTPSGNAVTTGQTIIATTQLITPANMHATITKMTTPTTNSTTGAVSNVTVSLARPLTTSTSSVAIVPTPVTAASLVQSPSKVVATSSSRPSAISVTHRVAGAINAANLSGSSTPVVSLASVTLQGQPTIATSLMNKSSIQALQQVASSTGTTILQTRTPAVSQSATSTASTVLQQAIQKSKPSSSAATVSAILTQSQLSNVTPVVAVESLTAIPLTTVPNVTTVTTTPASESTTTTEAEQSSVTPDATRTYAMRPRKTT